MNFNPDKKIPEASFEQKMNDISKKYIQPNITREHAMIISNEANNLAHSGQMTFRDEIIYDPNDKTPYALNDLPDDLLSRIAAHGVGSNVPYEHINDRLFGLNALMAILTTGQVIGGAEFLKNNVDVSVFTNAPFLLVSNQSESLIGENGQIKSLRAVVVNGKFEGLIPNLQKAFPNVVFVKAEDLSENFFENKGTFKSWVDVASGK